MTPDGGAVMSALEADFEKDSYEDTLPAGGFFRRSRGRSARWDLQQICVICPKGVFVSGNGDGN
jgi:hypothetical protein